MPGKVSVMLIIILTLVFILLGLNQNFVCIIVLHATTIKIFYKHVTNCF
jgi:hypothetical protein